MATRKPADPVALLRRAIKAGADFGTFMGLYAEKNSEQDEAIIEKAREEHHVDGEVEIDGTTICSGSDGPGDYVLAWVWVDFDKAGF